MKHALSMSPSEFHTQEIIRIAEKRCDKLLFNKIVTIFYIFFCNLLFCWCLLFILCPTASVWKHNCKWASDIYCNAWELSHFFHRHMKLWKMLVCCVQNIFVGWRITCFLQRSKCTTGSFCTSPSKLFCQPSCHKREFLFVIPKLCFTDKIL